MKKRIASTNEHASPVTLHGEDASNEIVYISELTKQLSKIGFTVDIFTRRTSEKPGLTTRLHGTRTIYIYANPGLSDHGYKIKNTAQFHPIQIL